MPPSLGLRNIGQIQEADLSFGDLTVLVGPQASGKSIALQWLKLVLDTGLVQAQLSQYGLDWGKSLPKFLDLYFGEGMHTVWQDGLSEVLWDHQPWEANKKIGRKAVSKKESVFLIPAQRVLTLRDGWPRPFSDFSAGDPFAVRSFSEKLRLLMEQELGAGDAVFPKSNRLKSEYRKLLEKTIFQQFRLKVDALRSQKRLVLGQTAGAAPLPYMVWSAGQREFVPLLLGLYWLMPPAKVSRRNDVRWVIIEEPEMGMHPRAITAVLLLVLELLDRGYRVCISTHVPQVLDFVWVIQKLGRTQAKPEELLQVFEAPNTQGLRTVAANALKKECKVYFFDGDSGQVHDITGLDPASLDKTESSWGGMLDFSGRANEAVATAMANTGTLFPL
jgi:hypothetical protein